MSCGRGCVDGSDVSCRPATTPAQAAAEKKRMEEVERKREQERQVRVIIVSVFMHV